MATIASLRILLGLDSGDVSKGSGRVRGDLRGVQREANVTRDALRGVAAGFGLGAGLGAFQVASRAVSEFTDLVGDSVKAAIAEEAGIKRLDQSLRANVASYDGNRAAIERVIEARQSLGFADDEQRDAMARALVATNDVARAQDVLATAMDLARLKGIDLGSATDALIKIEGGQFRALKALGIELAAGATQTEALAAVQRVAAGQAKEFGDTTAGSMAEAGIAVDNLKEEFGAVLMPAIGEVAEFLTNDLIPAIKDVATGVGALGAAFGDAIRPVNDLRIALDVEWPDFIPFVGTITSLKKAAEEATSTGRTFAGSWTDAGAVVGTAASASNAAAMEINDLGLSAQATAFYAAQLSTALGDIPTDIDITITTTRKDVGIGVAERIAAKGDNPNDTGNAQFTLDQLERERQLAAERQAERERLARERTAAGNKVAREAEAAANKAAREREAAAAKRAAEEAQRVGWALSDSFDAAKDKARDFFDALHAGNLKAIDDIRDKANEELSAQQKAIRGVVDAEQQRINAVRAREQENELRGAVGAALTPEDRTAAQRDLNRFLEDQRLARMRASADISVALIDQQKATNDQLAADQTAAENKRAADRRKAFDDEIAALAKDAARHPEHSAAAMKRIGELVSGIPTLSAGIGTAQPITIVNNFYVDGEKITEVVDRRLAGLSSVYNPQPPSASGRV